MEFEIDTAEFLKIDNIELSKLLMEVYVEGGYTKPDEAVTHFEPGAVKQRGMMIIAREKRQSRLAGIVIVVPPNSPARRLAQDNEAELQLLGVRPEYRGYGLGRKLVTCAIDNAKQSAYTKLVLWTQPSMPLAQKIYETSGFLHVDDMVRNGRDFKIYELSLAA